jgi:uncharacterized protein involved in outer membrane biogenesis
MPNQQRSLFRLIVRGVGFALAGLLILLLLAAGGFAWWLSRADLKPIVEREATEALGRRVTMANFAVRWGDPLGIDFTDLSIANAPWGSKPEMVRIGAFSALLDVAPLLHGVLRYERLRISDATIVLERDPGGVGNWKFSGSAGSGGFGLVPKKRRQFPTLIDFIGDRALITYRTRSGHILRIALDEIAISSPSDDTPARLVAQGSYNDVATHLDATTGSYRMLRDDSQPFGTHFTLAAKETNIAFDGTLQEPLDFEGARGRLWIDARTLNDILGAMGAKAKADLPLSVAGMLNRDGDHWSLAAAKGHLLQSDFSGDLALLEGGQGEPDDISLDLDFGALDADAMAAAFGGAQEKKFDALPLHPKGLSAVNLTADLATPRLSIGGREFRAVTLQGRLAAGDVTLKELSFALGGGTLGTAGALAGDRLSLQSHLIKADIGEIAQELGGTGEEIHGRLDGAATLSMAGPTIGAALKASEGAAVLILRDGDVARSLIEKLSADLRSLFRSKEGSVPVSCLLGVVTVKDGIGVLSPLRLESREAVAVGAGKIDLVKDTLELTVKTERDSTNFFALDIPIRISGPFDKISAKPAPGTDASWLEQPAAAAEALPPDLRKVAASSPCRD